MTRAISILIGALGGQGGGVLAEWLVDVAVRAGHAAQGTSIPGVAQRTGATTYYVEIFPVPLSAADGRRPVLGLYPVPGDLDLIVASELVEATRIVSAGYASPARTTLLPSLSRTLTTQEKIALGDGRLDSARLLEIVRGQARRCAPFDADAIANATGSAVSAILFGAVAGSGVLPFERAAYEAVIRDAGLAVDASLAGFDRGFAAVGAAPGDVPSSDAAGPATPPVPNAAAGQAPSGLPADVLEMAIPGRARVLEFQDERYARLYDERLARVLAAERAGGARDRFPTTRETARFLALWMAYDDIVRVARFKCRASRFARVRREVGAADGDVVRIVDHFKPGVPEFAAVLPPWAASRLVAWDRRRQARGEEPLSWPLKLRSDGVRGFVALRLLAGLRGLRRASSRYAEEQAQIERWVAAVVDGVTAAPALGLELALCGRLIKGYGATNERAKRNLDHILLHLAGLPGPVDPAARAAAIRAARESALADEGGTALDEALRQHGAPARPVVAQPIVWKKRTSGPVRDRHVA